MRCGSSGYLCLCWRCLAWLLMEQCHDRQNKIPPNNAARSPPVLDIRRRHCILGVDIHATVVAAMSIQARAEAIIELCERGPIPGGVSEKIKAEAHALLDELGNMRVDMILNDFDVEEYEALDCE